MSILFQLTILLLGPLVFMFLHEKQLSPSWLGPVVLSYLLGILVASIGLVEVQADLSKQASEGSVLLAIPLLLFSTNIRAWLSNARSTIHSFICCVLAAGIVSFLGGMYLSDNYPEAWQAAGMMAGVNTGGTPNMQAVGLALDASDSLFLQLNAADILYGGIYLLFLSSIAKGVLARWYPKFEHNEEDFNDEIDGKEINPRAIDYGKSFLLSLTVVSFTVGVVYLVFGDLSNVIFIILLLTSLGVGLSFLESVRHQKGAFELGNYLLLVFCVAIGMRSDASQILNNSTFVLQYYGLIYFGTILLHYLLAYFLRIDRDTLLITSTASIYGPAFVGQIAHVLGNKQIVVAGMATGLMGYAIGNYLGIGVALLVQFLSG